MIKRLNIKDFEIVFVFKHKWQETNKLLRNHELRNYNLGLWFKMNKVVGKKDFNKPDKWNDNLVNNYMIGIDLIICTAWVDFNIGGMSFKF
jgi:hypothetical protein